jgi:glycosidase
MPGVPLVYNGQELGVTDSVSFFARTPYDWTRQPEIRDFYHEYLTLYRDSPALQHGSMEVHTPEAEDALVYERKTEDETMLVAVNVRDASATVSVPDAHTDASLTDALSGATVEGAAMELGPYGYRLLRVE